MSDDSSQLTPDSSADSLSGGTIGQQADQANPAPAPVTNTQGPVTDPAPPPPAAPAPSAPSPAPLWRNVLMGALQGLAAAPSGKGMSGGAAFAAGLGAGANQVLNVHPAQQSALNREAADTATQWATSAKMQRDLHLMPEDRQQAAIDKLADHSQDLIDSGAVSLSSQPTDLISAQKAQMAAHAKDPNTFTNLIPIRGADGNIQYATVTPNKGPLQNDVDITLPSGAHYKAKAGTPADLFYKGYTTVLEHDLGNVTKQKVATGNQQNRVDVQKLKNQGAEDVANIKANAAQSAAGTKAQDMLFGTSADGRQVAGSQAELQAAGIQNPVKLPGIEAQKVVVARQLIGPRKGLFDLVNNDINNLSQQGKIGVAASRWGDFMAGKVGDDPDFQALRTHMGLLSTALMQAHVGARGSKDMLQHFKDLANYSISNEATLRKALNSEWEYVNEKAMLPAGNPVSGRTGPGQAPPKPAGAAPAATGPSSFAAWKAQQGQ